MSTAGGSLLDRIQQRKEKLRPVETIVSTEDGSQSVEHRLSDGSIERTSLGIRTHGFVVDLKPDLQMAEISPRVFLGSQDVAADLNLLQLHQISHIINLAGIPELFPDHFTYLSLDILDEPSFDICPYLKQCVQFISQAINTHNKNGVLIHCNAGVSRAATVSIAYLMLHEHMPLQQAHDTAKSVRPVIKPNQGFWAQLQQLDKTLHRKSVGDN